MPSEFYGFPPSPTSYIGDCITNVGGGLIPGSIYHHRIHSDDDFLRDPTSVLAAYQSREGIQFTKWHTSPACDVRLLTGVFNDDYHSGIGPTFTIALMHGRSCERERTIQIGGYIFDPAVYGHGFIKEFGGFFGKFPIIHAYFYNGRKSTPKYWIKYPVTILIDPLRMELPLLRRWEAKLRAFWYRKTVYPLKERHSRNGVDWEAATSNVADSSFNSYIFPADNCSSIV